MGDDRFRAPLLRRHQGDRRRSSRGGVGSAEQWSYRRRYGIEEKAGHNANDLAGFTTTSTPKCWCDNGDAVDCIEGVCAEGVPQVWVEVHTEKTFEMLVNFPGIPHTVDIGQYTRMRVQ